nr:glycosyltransferase family 2 protein [Acuticoccus mangrovi]
MPLDGYIEEIDDGVVRGWVWGPADPSEPLIVTATLAGVVLGAARADLYRPDLATHHKRDGFCGFELVLSRSALVMARFKMRQLGPARCELEFSVQRLKDGRLGPREHWTSLDRSHSARIYAPATLRASRGLCQDVRTVFGALDRLDQDTIAGWCFHSTLDHGSAPLLVDLLVDDVWADTAVAATPTWTERVGQRVSGASGAAEQMRFRFRTPPFLRDGHAHRVAVAVKGSDGALIDAPALVRLPSEAASTVSTFRMPPLIPPSTQMAGCADGPRQGEYERWIEEVERAAAEPFAPPAAGWPSLTVLIETRTLKVSERAALAETEASIRQQDVGAQIIHFGPGPADHRRTLKQAIGEATGEIVALCAAGDVVADGALATLLRTTAAEREAVLFYSDDDLLDAMGTRRRPRFKTAYCPDRALTDDVFSGLTAMRAEAARDAVATSPLPLDTATLAVKVARAVASRAICHIPRVLAHRAMGQPPRAKWQSAFVSALLQGEAAARGVAAPLVIDEEGRRILWPRPATPLSVSVIIPTKDRAALFEPLVHSLLADAGDLDIEILIVNNDSREEATFAAFRRLVSDPRVRILYVPDPFNYSTVNNFAVAESRGDIIVFANNDIAEPVPGTLDEMVRQALRPDIGIVGARLSYADGTNQHCGVALGIGGVGSHLLKGHSDLGRADHGRFRHAQTLSAVTAALMAMRREVFEAVGGFDEVLSIAYNDVDLCLRVTAETGLRVLYTPYAAAYHLESQSRGLDRTPAKRARLAREKALMTSRWSDVLFSDPYLSPNHSLTSRDLRPAHPPRVAAVAPRFTREAAE